MSSKIKKYKTVQTSAPREEKKPGLFRRLGAYMADWFVGDLFAALPVALIYAQVNKTAELSKDLMAFQWRYGVIAGILALVFSSVYFVILPWKVWNGQTIGKKMCGLCIVSGDGGKVGLKALIVRHVLGIILLEGCLMTASHYLRQLMFLLTNADWVLKWPYYIGMGFALLSGIMIVFGRSRRGLHDYLAGTKVIATADV